MPLISAAAEEVLPLVRLPKTDVAVISADFDGVTKKGLQIARLVGNCEISRRLDNRLHNSPVLHWTKAGSLSQFTSALPACDSGT